MVLLSGEPLATPIYRGNAHATSGRPSELPPVGASHGRAPATPPYTGNANTASDNLLPTNLVSAPLSRGPPATRPSIGTPTAPLGVSYPQPSWFIFLEWPLAPSYHSSAYAASSRLLPVHPDDE